MNRIPRIETLLQNKLQELDFHAFTEGGKKPVSIHFGDIFSNTVRFWKRRLDDLGLQYNIAFALKATGQHEYLKICKEEGISVDVASKNELQVSIDSGIPAKKIIANGPKNIGFIEEAIKVGCLIAINSNNELIQIQKIIEEKYPLTLVSIIFRVQTPGSRFGIPIDFFYKNTLDQGLYKNISIVGLSFHSDTTELKEKIMMIHTIVALQQHLSATGHVIHTISIGGGYRVKYCENTLQTQGTREYYQGGGLYGINFLDEMLHCEIDGQPFYEYLIESFTTLIIEPGRSLLDQAGILIHTIIDKNKQGISIDGNIYSTGTIAQEMPHDPILLSSKGEFHFTNADHSTYPTAIYGNLCLESDRIYTRKIPFNCEPQIGDQILFINTAGYFSDFSHAQPIGHNDRKTLFI